ncbi:MAG TPA: cytochrome c maturation protein CcmE [Micromonosporaceae bacterium]|jgi:cytochrome c-type biogenesis protein CcmE|nr:cytochrome c maturation protein CcmE [Micromonosporaceae bacterium]
MSQDLLHMPDATADDPPVRGWRAPRWRLIACLLVVVGALAFIAVRGLTGNFVYYLTPTDIVGNHKAHVGERVRLGGYVVPGSVHQTRSTLTFTITDGTDSMQVSDTGSVPELFKPGQGVVLEGALGADGLFHSDTLLVQHNGDYRPPKPGQKPPNRANLAGG